MDNWNRRVTIDVRSVAQFCNTIAEIPSKPEDFLLSSIYFVLDRVHRESQLRYSKWNRTNDDLQIIHIIYKVVTNQLSIIREGKEILEKFLRDILFASGEKDLPCITSERTKPNLVNI